MGGIRTVMLVAWIVWMHGTSPGLDKNVWTPTRAVETLEECQAIIDIVLTNSAARNPRAKRTGNVIDMTLPGGTTASFSGVCLPENIDPRR